MSFPFHAFPKIDVCVLHITDVAHVYIVLVCCMLHCVNSFMLCCINPTSTTTVAIFLIDVKLFSVNKVV